MAKPVLLLTRPENKTASFVARLNPSVLQLASVVVSPLLQIVPTAQTVCTEGFNGFIFTSGQAVALSPAGAGRPAFCVGQTTAAAAKAAGWRVVLAAQDAAHLITEFPTATNGPFLHLSGEHRRGDIAARLSARGQHTEVCVLYFQRLIPLSNTAMAALAGKKPVIAPVFSPRTAAHLASQVQSVPDLTVLAISDAAAQAFAPNHGARVVRAAEPTGDAMAQMVENLIQRASLP